MEPNKQAFLYIIKTGPERRGCHQSKVYPCVFYRNNQLYQPMLMIV